MAPRLRQALNSARGLASAIGRPLVAFGRGRGSLTVIPPGAGPGDGPVRGHTPLPRFDDYGDYSRNLSAQFWLLGGPSPEQIEWLWLRSDEWGQVVTGLTMRVWRREPEIVPVHEKYCTACGQGSDGSGDKGCPMCGAGPEFLQDPDPWERRRLEDFAKLANRRSRMSLAAVGRRKTEEGLKHGRSFLIFQYEYLLDAKDGTMREAKLVGVHPGAPSRIQRLTDDRGRPGGHFICLRCRDREAYQASGKRGRCADCGWILHEAWFGEQVSLPADAHGSGAFAAYYLPHEVAETKWPYSDGTPPIARLWPKTSGLLLMDWYAAWALDPKRDKRPDKVIVTAGGDEERIEKWVKDDAERRRTNPYALSWLHIPGPPGGFEELRVLAEVLDLGEETFKGQMPELRKEFEARIRKQYHLSPVQAGDTEQSGGLNNEGLQIRTTAEVVEDLQNHEQQALALVAERLGVYQWTWRFPPALEEDESRVADLKQKELTVAKEAAGLGLPVRWENDRAVVSEGPVRPPQPAMMPGLPGQPAPPGQFGAPGDLQPLEGELPLLDDVGLPGAAPPVPTGQEAEPSSFRPRPPGA